jgi:hypothetical protein
MRGLRADTLIAGAFGAWLVATAASQHPHRAFDRFRDYDPIGLILPDWRFFAPEPAQHDFHLLCRVLSADERQIPWSEATRITPRLWSHAVWFPDRRRDKAIVDICNELITLMNVPSLELTDTCPFLLLRDFVEGRIRDEYAGRPAPQGFQFLIARHTGHDQTRDPDYLLISPFIPLEEAR